MDRFEDLRTFVVVAEEQSVSGAARALDRAASAVSRRVTELETRLGAQLFVRTTRRVTLTAAGESLLIRARAVLAELDEAETSVREARQALSGTLRIGAPLSFGLAHLMPILNGFMLEHPALLVELDLDDRKVDLVAQRLDLAVRIGELTDLSLKSRKLGEARLLLAASPSWWEAHGKPAAAEDLEGAPALCYTNLDRPGLWAWQRGDDAVGELRLKPRFSASNGDALVQAAIAGFGLVRLPDFLVGAAIEAGTLMPLLQDHTWGHVGVHAIYPDTRHVPARTRAIIDYLVARNEGESGSRHTSSTGSVTSD